MFAFVVLGSVYSVLSQEIGSEERLPKLTCIVLSGMYNLNSVNQSGIRGRRTLRRNQVTQMQQEMAAKMVDIVVAICNGAWRTTAGRLDIYSQ